MNPKLFCLFSMFMLSFASNSGERIRYLAVDLGNLCLTCWEQKMYDPKVATHFQKYIKDFAPDVILMYGLQDSLQLLSTVDGGPLLPTTNYGYSCHTNQNRAGNLDPDVKGGDASDWSHQHTCIAFKLSRFSLVPSSAKTVLGPGGCSAHYTGHRCDIYDLKTRITLRAIAVNPDQENKKCRSQEAGMFWNALWGNFTRGPTIIGGNWNTEDLKEIQRPESFDVDYSKGAHADSFYRKDEYTEFISPLIGRKVDHVFSYGLGFPYVSAQVPHGSVVGGYDDHPRADGGTGGCHHRQILVERMMQPQKR